MLLWHYESHGPKYSVRNDKLSSESVCEKKELRKESDLAE